MKKLLRCLLILKISFGIAIAPIQAHAQALPASKVAIAVSKTLMTKMKMRGFAANDPKYGATLQAASVTLTDVAVTAASIGGAAAIGAIGAPVWLTLAGSVAVGYGLQLALDYFMPNLPPPKSMGAENPALQVISNNGIPTVSYSTKVSVPNPDRAPTNLILPDLGWYMGTPIEGIFANYEYANSQPQSTTPWIATNIQVGEKWYVAGDAGLIHELVNVSYTMIYCRGAIDIKPDCHGLAAPVVDRFMHLYGGHCPDGYTWSWDISACTPPTTIIQDKIQTGTTQDIANGKIDVGQGIKDSPINPQLIAKMADAAWQNAAAKPGYQGVPYVAADPVTQADVSNAYNPQNNPMNDPYPTVQDALNPVSAPGTTIVINLNPSTTPTTQPSIDLGPNPNIGSPSLEAIPTAQQILAPILNLFPSFKSFVVPQHISECPRPSVDVFEKHIVMDGHCSLLDASKPTLYAVMAFVWLAIGLFIILAA